MDNENFQAAPYGHNFYPCNWLWKSLAITWDGKVATCCGDFGPADGLWRPEQVSLREVWNGPQMVRIRTLQREAKLDKLPLCRGCDAPWQPDGPAGTRFHAASKVAGLTYRNGRST